MTDRDMSEHLKQLLASGREGVRTLLPQRLRGDAVDRAGGAPFRRDRLFDAAQARPDAGQHRPPAGAGLHHAQGQAVALLINSPGGSPVQSHLIYRRIRDLATENKLKVIAFAEDVAASGGYMIACAADEIICDPSSIVGSIGVVGGSFGFAGLLEKLGIERRLYTSGENKAMLDPFLPEKPEDVEKLKTVQRKIHEGFIALVRQSRGGRLNGAGRQAVLGRILDRRDGHRTRAGGRHRRSAQHVARALRRQGPDAAGVSAARAGSAGRSRGSAVVLDRRRSDLAGGRGVGDGSAGAVGALRALTAIGRRLGPAPSYKSLEKTQILHECSATNMGVEIPRRALQVSPGPNVIRAGDLPGDRPCRPF